MPIGWSGKKTRSVSLRDKGSCGGSRTQLEGSGHWNLTKEAGAGPALLGTCHQGRGRGLCHPWMARVVNLTLAGGSRRRLVVSFGGCV